MSHLTAKQIAQQLNIADRTVRIRAKRESWPCEMRPGRGGQTAHYLMAGLPTDIQAKLQSNTSPSTAAGQAAAQADKTLVKIQAQQQTNQRQDSLKSFAAITGEGKARAEANLRIIKAAQAHYQSSGLSKKAAQREFATLYNNQQLGLPDSTYAQRKTISRPTLCRLEKLYKEQGIAALAGNYGNRKNSGLINSNPDMQAYCVALVNEYPHIKPARIHELLEMRFAEQTIPDMRTCQRWLTQWKAENAEVFQSLSDPSGWQNKYMAAFGNAEAGIERINQLWEFDSTPADLLLTDGRFSIVGVIDVFTRRVKMVLTLTATSESVATVLRSAILDWGVPEMARTDNGKDYVSQQIGAAFDGLEIEQDVTNPYSGWEKSFIERFFRTFSHGMAEQLAGFIGHNVAERKAIQQRLPFAKQLMEKRAKGEERVGIDVQLSSTQLQEYIDKWVDGYYHHKPHSGLGCTPFEKLTNNRHKTRILSDERLLDIMLAPLPSQKGFRTVSKTGISVSGADYIHAELGSMVGQRVFCRYNPNDISEIYVFNPIDNEFICKAVNPELAGEDITFHHAQEAKKAQRRALSAQRKSIREASKMHDVSDEARKYIDYKYQQNKALTGLPSPFEPLQTQSTEAAKSAISNQATQRSQQQLDDLEKRRLELQQIEEAAAKPAAPVFSSEHQKARYLSERALNNSITPSEKAWLHEYRRKNKRAAAMLDKLFDNPQQQQR